MRNNRFSPNVGNDITTACLKSIQLHFRAILSSYGNREFCSDEFSTRLHPTTGFIGFRCGRNLAADGVDSAVRKTSLKSPNMLPNQALLKGLSP